MSFRFPGKTDDLVLITAMADGDMGAFAEIYKRYKAPDGNQPSIGQAWIDLNLPLLVVMFLTTNLLQPSISGTIILLLIP